MSKICVYILTQDRHFMECNEWSNEACSSGCHCIGGYWEIGFKIG